MKNFYGAKHLERNLRNILIYGSYPQIVNKDFLEPEDTLNELSTSYLYKDVLNFESLKNPELLNKISQAIALQLGSEVSYREIASLVGTDHETVQRYISLLEKAFVIFKLKSLSRNSRNEIKKKGGYIFMILA